MFFNNYKVRTTDFKWNSKLDLYEYFEDVFKISRERIDREIDVAMGSFVVRKGCQVNTRELWQKVGTKLERELGTFNI